MSLHGLLNIATGRSIYSTWFFILWSFSIPFAFIFRPPWLILYAWAGALVMGLFILVTGIVTLTEARASHNWPKTRAENLKLGVQRRHGSRGGALYTPNIQCQFNVGNESFRGTRLDFGDRWSSEAWARQKVTELEQRKDCLQLYYNPKDPNLNVIYPGVRFVHYLRIWLGMIVLVIASLGISGRLDFLLY